MKRVYLLTGEPGTGKTTLIREVIAKLRVKAGGFYTEEIRKGGVRQGFKLITLDGDEAILSHISFSSPYRVSKYGVDIGNLDRVGVAAINRAINEADLIVIDEIGKMELFSPKFKDAVLKAINSSKKVLGTIMLSPNPFADEIKRHPEAKVLTVTRTNREEVLQEIQRWLEVKE